MPENNILEYRRETKTLAKSLNKSDVYHWLVDNGYFPESYILPPCFRVKTRPNRPKVFYKVNRKGGYKPEITECVNIQFPKSDLIDRIFGLMDPRIHNDIAFHLASNWGDVVEAMIPKNSQVTSYTFPIPVDSKKPGRVGHLRSGRMIYQFIEMTDSDIATIAYQYSHIVNTDIKNFYPSIYTHSIAWALHGKKYIKKNRFDYGLLGNKLDKLFQNANDGCTNGIPIGPFVSDIIAEIVASAVDQILTNSVQSESIKCEIIRFKDDYRILVQSEKDGKAILKLLQESLKQYNLVLNEDKTTITELPQGLFRKWVSEYYSLHPKKKDKYSWKDFRETYLGVIKIDQKYPGTGVIDRFLADIVSKKGKLKVKVDSKNLQKIISMLLMISRLRIKAFPKVLAILESILQSPFGKKHKKEIVTYLDNYLGDLSKEEERNQYLITWISYFVVSNSLKNLLKTKPKLSGSITRSVFNNRGNLFKNRKDYKLFTGCKSIAKKVSMLKHLDVFDPPNPIN